MFFIYVLLNYFQIGGLYAIFPGSVTNTFGLKMGPQIYSIILLASPISSSLNILMTTVLLDNTSYEFCFLTGSVVTALSILVMWFFKEDLDAKNLARWNALDVVLNVVTKDDVDLSNKFY